MRVGSAPFLSVSEFDETESAWEGVDIGDCSAVSGAEVFGKTGVSKGRVGRVPVEVGVWVMGIDGGVDFSGSEFSVDR